MIRMEKGGSRHFVPLSAVFDTGSYFAGIPLSAAPVFLIRANGIKGFFLFFS